MPGSGLVSSFLIQPTQAWKEARDSWDPRAQRIHGILPDFLAREGHDVAVVAARFTEALERREPVSDFPDLDQRMMARLLGPGAPPLHDFWGTTRMSGGRPREAMAVNGVDQAFPARHRAGDDVRRLDYMWRVMVSS